jgi:hypothetical protein
MVSGLLPPPPPPYSDEYYGAIGVVRSHFGALIQESLFFTSGGVIVARTAGRYWHLLGALGTATQFEVAEGRRLKLAGSSVEQILKDNENNFAVAKYEILRVVLKQRTLGAVNITISTSQKELTWTVVGSYFGQDIKKDFDIYAKILKSAFPDRLQIIR